MAKKVNEKKPENVVKAIHWLFKRSIAVAVVCGACNPVAPSYVCRTQPRVYILVDGTRQLEVDTYRQSEPCPVVPIE